jgi:hypothetical protein
MSLSPSTEPSDDTTTENQPLSIGHEINLFEKHVSSISDVLPGMVVALEMAAKSAQKDLHAFEKEHCVVVDGEGGHYVRISGDHVTKWRRLHKKVNQFDSSKELLPRSLLVSLVAQYDAFLGRLLKVCFIKKPELLHTSDKQVTFEVINQFESLDALREYMLEKEIETVLRKSHLDQLQVVERLCNVPLTKGLDFLPSFIEITERRNLFVHTDGVVSSQYMATCKANGVTLEPLIKEGRRLRVTPKYFSESCECIHEIGVKLGHVLWRKLFPNEREEADNHYLEYTFELLQAGKYKLVIRLLELACSVFSKQSAESEGLIFRINLAQAHKWNGDEGRCRRVLAETDWSAKEDKFKLAHAVLHDNWVEVDALMRRIGTSDAVGADAYRDWPLFRKLREQPIFAPTYLEIFGKPYEPPTATRERRGKKKKRHEGNGMPLDAPGADA